MATKDWKLIGRHLGMNRDITEYGNKKKNLLITTRKNWSNVNITRNGVNMSKQKFKNEKDKLKFIKSYMREH